MIAGILTMGLGEVTQTFTNPVFIGEIQMELEKNQEISIELEQNNISLILE